MDNTIGKFINVDNILTYVAYIETIRRGKQNFYYLTQTVRDGELRVNKAVGDVLEVVEPVMEAGEFAVGDYYCINDSGERKKIVANSENTITISDKFSTGVDSGGIIAVQVRLQRPYMDIDKCIGCGVCEHECPVSGKRAVRISAEGETRSAERRLLISS